MLTINVSTSYLFSIRNLLLNIKRLSHHTASASSHPFGCRMNVRSMPQNCLHIYYCCNGSMKNNGFTMSHYCRLKIVLFIIDYFNNVDRSVLLSFTICKKWTFLRLVLRVVFVCRPPTKPTKKSWNLKLRVAVNGKRWNKFNCPLCLY